MKEEIKTNYCNTAGECTAPDFRAESKCRFCLGAGIYRGGCLMRSWYGVCMSQDAQDAAEAQARMTRKLMEEAK